MSQVTVSPKFQVVIPREVREAFGLRPGQKMEILAIDRRIEIVPVLPIQSLRGLAPGIDTTVERDEDRL